MIDPRHPAFHKPRPLGFDDRLRLAYSDVVMVYEARDGFLSDDNVLDVAERWSVADFASDDEAGWDDYEALRDALFTLLAPDADA